MKRCWVLLLLVSCGKDVTQPLESALLFTEVKTDIAPTVCGAEDPTQIIEVNGTGLALFDFDNDGDLDLFVVNAASLDDYSSGPGCRLYANISGENIVFQDVTEDMGIDIHAWANGVAVGDVNGDGYDDLYVTCHGPNVLLVNQEGKAFSNQTVEAGIGDDQWGTSARFGDLDGDGDLDLYVCNYVEFDANNPPSRATYKGLSVLGGPHGMTPQHDLVYENLGHGTFRDVTIQWGFTHEPAFALNVAILDVNGDGLQDVFVGNDSMSNHLYINTGESPTRFENVGVRNGIAVNGDGSMQATMGIAVADVNGNNRPDIFTTNFSSDTNTLQINDDSGFFDDQTKQYGLGLLSRSLLGWTCGFHDFDHDGDEDLFIVNGHVYPEATRESIDSNREQPILLLERVGNRFVQCVQTNVYRDRTAVFGDLDSDGDIDVVIAQRSGNVRVMRNDSPSRNTHGVHRLLTIALRGNGANTKGLGATIHLTLDDGTVISRWNTDGFGFQSSISSAMTITIPEGKIPTQVEVVWPNGTRQIVTDLQEVGIQVIVQPVSK